MIESSVIDISIELCRSGAMLPCYAHPFDGGMDITLPENITIAAGQTIIAPAGLKVAIPNGWMLLIFPRSGLSARTGLRVANSPGLIDSGYRDEIGIILHNTASEPIMLQAGTRLAQLVLVRRTEIHFIQVNSVAEIGENRGGGFGHSGS